jgi:hypothetical protein
MTTTTTSSTRVKPFGCLVLILLAPGAGPSRAGPMSGRSARTGGTPGAWGRVPRALAV